MANVVIKRQYAAYNVDSYNRTVVCDETIENGCVFALNGRSENVMEEGEVWKASKPANANATNLWMAVSPEVVIIESNGNEYKGLTPDPRAFKNLKGKMIDAIKLCVGDIIEMTAEGLGTPESHNFLIPQSENYKLVSDASASGTGLKLKKIGKSQLHIGQGGIGNKPIATYIYEVVNN